MFVDTAKVKLKAGKGGDGAVSFRHEIYIPKGGPDGGDGGDGGNIKFVGDNTLSTLYKFRHKRHYAAADGQKGGENNCHGKNAEDIIIKVPLGTTITDKTTGEVLADIIEN
jgi:GTP-binding protein